jgi:adenosine deaminase
MGANFESLIEALDLSSENIRILIKNSFSGSFLSDGEKRAYLAAVDKVQA